MWIIFPKWKLLSFCPERQSILKLIRAWGVRTALGSASKNALLIINRLGIAPLFDVIIDGNQVSQAKPNPEIFLRAAEGLGLPPTCCNVFEDAAAGIEAAHRAGMGAIGVGKPAQLKDADMVIDGLYQLVAIQLAWNIKKITSPT